MIQDTPRSEQIKVIIEAINNGIGFVFNDEQFEYKAARYAPPTNAVFRFDDSYKFSTRVHWADRAGLAHVCSADELIEHMEDHAELSAWVRLG